MYQANATLTFTVPSGAVSYDPVTGNPVVGGNTPFVLSCYLNYASKNEIQSIPGVDPNKLYMTGRCLIPRSLPAQIRNRSLAKLELKQGNGSSSNGKFYLLDVPRSPLGLESIFAQAIFGYVEFQ